MDRRYSGDDEEQEGPQKEAENDLLLDFAEDEEEIAPIEEVEVEIPSPKSETLIERLDLLQGDDHDDDQGPRPFNILRALDGRSYQVREDIKAKFKEAPKTILALAEEKKPNIERQLEKTAYRLKELAEFGDELVTNIKVANEKREWLRRGDEIQRRQKLEAEIRRETIESMARFDNITSRWTELNEINEPVSLFENLERQKERIATLMRSKDDIILQCQQEIDRVNGRYYADQQQKATDLCCLIERVDTQVELMKKAYKCHLDMLQDRIEEERRAIQLDANTKWQDFYENMLKQEDRKFAIAAERERFYAEQIESITKQQEEITRATRIRLAKDAEMLEWELRNVKNNVLMNSEKLDYNYQVLQKRNDENIVINNEQKHRVARLNDAITAMKHRIITSKTKANQNKQKLNADIQKLHASITELEQKAQQFERNNRQKFNKVWAMNYKEMSTAVEKVLEIDRILHEQQLLMPWQKPNIDLTDINPETAGTAQTRANTAPKTTKRAGTAATLNRGNITDVRLMRNILRQIADKGGFLVEERLTIIMAPYTDEERNLVRIDNIFNALHIKDMDSVSALIKYFVPYSWCPNCTNGAVPDNVIKRIYELQQNNKQSETNATIEEDNNVVISTEKSRNCKSHYLVTEPSLVLNALQSFTSTHQAAIIRTRGNIRNSEKTATDSNTMSLAGTQLDSETITQFWAKFRNCLPEDKQKLWASLEHGLNHYLDVLKKRAQLDNECSFLKRQNVELRHLLQKFV